MLTDEEEDRFRQLVADLSPDEGPPVARAVAYLAGAAVLVVCVTFTLTIHPLIALVPVLAALACLVRATDIFLPRPGRDRDEQRRRS